MRARRCPHASSRVMHVTCMPHADTSSNKQSSSAHALCLHVRCGTRAHVSSLHDTQVIQHQVIAASTPYLTSAVQL